jgi:DnaK suppressor protein
MASTTAIYETLLVQKRHSVVLNLGIDPELNSITAIAEEDRALLSQEEFVWSKLNNIASAQLRLIDEALDRIRTGDYGSCAGCEGAISSKRLKALPWAKYCIECQEEMGGCS